MGVVWVPLAWVFGVLFCPPVWEAVRFTMKALFYGGLAVLLLGVFATWARGEPPASTLEADLERVRVRPREAPARAPCEVRPRPAAEIEESSDRDPVPPAPRKPAAPKKGTPDGRRVADADPVPALEGPQLAQGPVRVTGTREQVFGHFAGLARAAGRPVAFDYSGFDGGRVSLRANPDGTVDVIDAPVVAQAPPPPPVVPYQGGYPPPARYTPPPTYYQPMPRPGVVAGYPFRGAGPIPHEGHNCPTCSRPEFVVERFTPTGHVHRCRACNTEWTHR